MFMILVSLLCVEVQEQIQIFFFFLLKKLIFTTDLQKLHVINTQKQICIIINDRFKRPVESRTICNLKNELKIAWIFWLINFGIWRSHFKQILKK